MTAVTHPDAQKWNKKFKEEGDAWLRNSPNPFLLSIASYLPTSGLALDVAAGVGTNGLYLAERGMHVIALDISEVGLKLARERAQGLQLETAVIDLASIWLPADYFDVILNFRFLERSTFPVYKRALRPGGWLVFETFVQGETAVAHPHYYLQPEELRHAFADFKIAHYRETNDRRKNVAQLLAQKPLPGDESS